MQGLAAEVFRFIDAGVTGGANRSELRRGPKAPKGAARLDMQRMER